MAAIPKYYTPDLAEARALKTFYVTFEFGARHVIGADLLPMWRRWVEVKARSRSAALSMATSRFGREGWQLNGEDGFTPARRQFYPDGCCLILIDPER